VVLDSGDAGDQLSSRGARLHHYRNADRIYIIAVIDIRRVAEYREGASWKKASCELGVFRFYTQLFQPRHTRPLALLSRKAAGGSCRGWIILE
jgi:hypothetical protein